MCVNIIDDMLVGTRLWEDNFEVSCVKFNRWCGSCTTTSVCSVCFQEVSIQIKKVDQCKVSYMRLCWLCKNALYIQTVKRMVVCI